MLNKNPDTGTVGRVCVCALETGKCVCTLETGKDRVTGKGGGTYEYPSNLIASSIINHRQVVHQVVFYT